MSSPPSAPPSTPPLSLTRPAKFEEAAFMKDLVHLKETQEAIQALSTWCIQNRRDSFKMTKCWLKCIKRVRTDQKLVLFYLYNDIVQHCKRKKVSDLLRNCQSVLKEALTALRKEEKILPKVMRVLKIWAEREVFEEHFIAAMNAVLEEDATKDSDQEIVDNFQPTQLCTQLKIMKALEDDSDYKEKTLRESQLDLVDTETLRQNLKDRQHGNNFIGDFEEGRRRMEAYIKALEREINKRKQVIDLLAQGGKYYESLLSDANTVANAYSNFGKRVTLLKTKLEEKMPRLGKNYIDSISPMPSPDYDAPSPQADEMELELPDDESAPQIIEVAGNAGQMGHNSHQGNGDLNSRLDSMMENIPGVNDVPLPNDRHSGGGMNEFFNKISGESSATSTPPLPTSTNPQTWQATDSQNEGWQQRDWQSQPAPNAYSQQWPPNTQEPVPDWQIQTVDEEPPADNEATFMQTFSDGDSNRSHPADSSDKPSLQDRLRNLAGFPVSEAHPLTAPDHPHNKQPPPPHHHQSNGHRGNRHQDGPRSFRPRGMAMPGPPRAAGFRMQIPGFRGRGLPRPMPSRGRGSFRGGPGPRGPRRDGPRW